MLRLALYLFGPPRLALDGEPVHISRRKAMALLAYLAVTGKSHSRDSLATLLWPENDQSSARAELRRMLSTLTQALGSGWVVADRETVCLNTDNHPSEGRTFWLDIIEFQGNLKVSETHNHPSTETCTDCLSAMEEAVELFQDDFMAGFSLKDCPAYDDWQFFQTEELRSKLADTLERLSSHFANLLDYETAISHAQRWLALDSLHEPAHQQLMRLYDQAGQRAAAIRQYQTCQQTLSNELGVEPSEETEELYQRIRSSTLISLPYTRPKSNLPAQSTPFIGRETELAEIRAKLKQDDCCLLTLLGPGGGGKTRLAIEAAGRILDDFKHGAFFVNLAPLGDADQIPSTIAGAIGFSFYGEGPPEEQLLDYLRNKAILLILDNFEHLLASAGYVSQVLSAAPGVKVLATSRNRLMVSGEHLYDVWGMAYPESPVSLKLASHQYSALKLFESEASRVQRDFTLSEDNLTDVIQICTLLEGMPLGIVLAANWMELLTPQEISVEIARNLEFLETELVDIPQRQRSLRSVFNHSWQLLGDHERKIFRVLSIFRGGFTQQAAQMIAGTSLKDLMQLAHKSILHRTPSGRFEIHELLRQYAAEKLALDPTVEAETREEHSGYFCQALAVWERDLQGSRQIVAVQEMAVEIDNIRAAWAWALDNARVKSLLDALNGFCQFFYVNRERIEGAAICQDLVEKLGTVRDSEGYKSGDLRMQNDTLRLQARSLAWGGFLNVWAGNLDLSYNLAQKCLSTLESSKLTEQDTRFEKAIVLLSLSVPMRGRSQDIQRTKQAVKLFDSLDERWWKGIALHRLGFYIRSEDRTESIKISEQSLAVRRALGDLRGIADVLRGLSWLAVSQFHFIEAEEMLQEALTIGVELEDRHNIVANSGALGLQWVWRGKFCHARSLLHETLAEYHDLVYTQSYAAFTHIRVSFPDLYLGEYQAARQQAQIALELYNEMQRFNAAFNIAVVGEILGSVALAEGSYQEADGWFQESLLAFHTYSIPDKIAKMLACLGYATRGLKKFSQAKTHFCQALQVSIDAEHYFPLTHALPGIALLFADQGDVERSVELYALADTQGIVANSKWFADIAGDQIAAVAAEELPSDVAEAAKVRGRSLDLWETAVDLLAELEELGWNNSDK